MLLWSAIVSGCRERKAGKYTILEWMDIELTVVGC